MNEVDLEKLRLDEFNDYLIMLSKMDNINLDRKILLLERYLENMKN
jgi:hypothetical protein